MWEQLLRWMFEQQKKKKLTPSQEQYSKQNKGFVYSDIEDPLSMSRSEFVDGKGPTGEYQYIRNEIERRNAIANNALRRANGPQLETQLRESFLEGLPLWQQNKEVMGEIHDSKLQRWMWNRQNRPEMFER